MTAHLGGRLCPLVDGQLHHDERDRALAHLAHCLSCRAQVVEYRRMKQRLAGLWAPTLPETLNDRLLGLDFSVVAGPVATSAAGGSDRAVARLVTWRESPPFDGPPLGGARFAGSESAGSFPGRPGRAPGGAGAPVRVRHRGLVWRPRPVVMVSARVVGFAAGTRPRSPARDDRARPTAILVVSAAFPRSGIPRPGGRRRMRRTLLSSAALMLLTMTAAAVGDQSTVGAATPARPTVLPAPRPVSNSAGTPPFVATVALVRH